MKGGPTGSTAYRSSATTRSRFLSLAAWLATALLIAGAPIAFPAWAKSTSGAKTASSEAEIEAATSDILRGQTPVHAAATLARLTDKQVREVLHRVTNELARQRAQATRVHDGNVLEELATALSRIGQTWSDLPAILEKRAAEMRASGADI